jgi:hypothetical protein
LLGAVLVLAGASAVVGQVNSPKVPGAGQSAEAFVVSSARNTLNERTADVTYRGKMVVGGQTLPIDGTGEVDFTQGASSARIQASVEGQPFVETEVVARGQLDMEVFVDGVNASAVLTGKPWVNLPIPASGSSPIGLGNVDPASALKLMTQQGAKVKFLGTSVIAGHTVSEYSITPSAKEMAGLVRRAVAAGQIPASAAQTASGVKKVLGTYTTDVWLDGSGLLRQQVLTISGGSAISGHVVSTFKNFGTAIHFVVPAASQTVSYVTFLKDAAAQSTSQ